MHDPDIKASVVAGLLTGRGISELSRLYNVPKGTVAGWRDEVRTDAGRVSERNRTRPNWAPDPNEGDFWLHLERLGKEYVVGLRTCVRYLSDPDVLATVPIAYDGYSAVVAAHESLGSRVAGLLQAGGPIQQRQPAAELEAGSVPTPARH